MVVNIYKNMDKVVTRDQDFTIVQ